MAPHTGVIMGKRLGMKRTNDMDKYKPKKTSPQVKSPNACLTYILTKYQTVVASFLVGAGRPITVEYETKTMLFC